jgi:NADH:ubiquinone oxidoreductase subunit 6 (subunit J)
MMTEVSHYVIAAMVAFIFLSMFIKGFAPRINVTSKRTSNELATLFVVYFVFPLFISFCTGIYFGWIK